MHNCVRLERRQRKDYLHINNDKKGTGGNKISKFMIFLAKHGKSNRNSLHTKKAKRKQ
jgi:hypothetical protein